MGFLIFLFFIIIIAIIIIILISTLHFLKSVFNEGNNGNTRAGSTRAPTGSNAGSAQYVDTGVLASLASLCYYILT